MATKTKKKARTWVCAECKEPKSEADVSSSCGEHGGVMCEGCAKNHEREVHAAPAAAARFRDRIKELRRVRAGDLLANPKNWRRHPDGQRGALTALLEEVGWSQALVARDTPEGPVLIDGHLRASVDPEERVPVLLLDVTEEEADKLLASLDPVAQMAIADAKAQRALVETINTESPFLEALLAGLMASEKRPALPKEDEEPASDEAYPRMVQLFYVAAKHADFVRLATECQRRTATSSLSEAVLAALIFAAEALPDDGNPAGS